MAEKRKEMELKMNLDNDDIVVGGVSSIARIVNKALEKVGIIETQEINLWDINGNKVGTLEIKETDE